MQEMYRERVKCIYIDPPYNTGGDGFLYRDQYQHSSWLSMMLDRLAVAYDFLHDDGVFFASIDNREVHRLRMLMDAILREENFYSALTFVSTTKPSNMGEARFNIQPNTEYILAYGKKPMTTRPRFNLVKVGEKQYPEMGKHGPFRREELAQRRNTGRARRDTMVYALLGIQPRKDYRWQLPPERYEELVEKGQIEIIDGKPFEVIYRKDEENDVFAPFWSHMEDVGTSETGKRELSKIIGHDHAFETVKPLGLLQKIIFHATGKDDINAGFFFRFRHNCACSCQFKPEKRNTAQIHLGRNGRLF